MQQNSLDLHCTMMDGLVNKLRLSYMIITVGFQTCVRSDPLLLIVNNINTALLVKVFLVIPVSLWVVFMIVSQLYKVCCFTATQREN